MADVNKMQKKLNSLNNQINKLNNEYNSLSDQRNKANSQKGNLRMKVASAADKLRMAEGKLNQVKNGTYISHDPEFDKLPKEKQIEIAENEYRRAKQEYEGAIQAQNDNETLIDGLDAEIATTAQEINDLSQQANNLQQAINNENNKNKNNTNGNQKKKINFHGNDVYLGKDGKIDLSLPENEKLLENSELIQEILRTYPEAFDKLPVSCFGNKENKDAYLKAFNDGVNDKIDKNDMGVDENGKKITEDEYIRQMTAIGEHKKKEYEQMMGLQESNSMGNR